MTRKLVDVSQDVIIQEQDCGTTNGIWVSAVYEGEDEVVKLADRIVGRFACDDMVNPTNPKEFIIHANEEIDEEKAKRLEATAIDRLRIRSVLTCESKHGICIHCYGRSLATGALVKLGEAVGIVARAIHRRTRHAAHHAYVPHRWYGRAGVQDSADQVQARRHHQVQRTPRRCARRWQQHRLEQERHHLDPRRRRTRTGKSHHRHRRGHFLQGWLEGEEVATHSSNGIRTTCRFSPRRPAR